MKPRTKRKICGAAALAGFALALGAVGGLERFVTLGAVARADERALAIRAAAEAWGEPWTRVAAHCEVEPLGEQWMCTCLRCKRTFFSGKAAAYCSSCAREKRRESEEYARARRVDRRVSGDGD